MPNFLTTNTRQLRRNLSTHTRAPQPTLLKSANTPLALLVPIPPHSPWSPGRTRSAYAKARRDALTLLREARTQEKP
jgi:hypothetical protein